jgi:hypothetical protein
MAGFWDSAGGFLNDAFEVADNVLDYVGDYVDIRELFGDAGASSPPSAPAHGGGGTVALAKSTSGVSSTLLIVFAIAIVAFLLLR